MVLPLSPVSVPDANSNVTKVTRMLWEGMGFGWAETAYSGVAHPRVPEALARVAALGFSRVIVFPYFLFTGVLVKRIYAETDAAAPAHGGIAFIKAKYLSDHPMVVETLADRLNEILTGDNAMNCQLCKYREQVIGYEREQGKPQAGHHHHVRGIGVGEAAPGHDHDHDHDHGHEHSHDHEHHHEHRDASSARARRGRD